MADYTWKQWENEQNEANNIHADDCYRWQAGIELAGGTWDGEWVDLDKTGKGLVTIDQFNALESQIQSKVSSYTPKNYDPSSTVQIVPGVDGWNKVENGILQSICAPTGVNRNWLQNTHDLTAQTGKISISNDWSISGTDEDGFGIMCSPASASGTLTFFMTKDAGANDWQGKSIAFSMDTLCDGFTSSGSTTFQNTAQVNFVIYGTNNFSSFTAKYRNTSRFSNTASGIFTFNTDDYKDGEWFRVKGIATVPPTDEMDLVSENEFSYYVYGFSLYISSTPQNDWYLKKPKFELADECTEWSPAPEDYGYPSDTTTLSATPQSVEDSDEVAAPEAEEIE